MSFHLRSNSSFVSWKIVFYYKCDKYQNCKFLNFNISGSFWLISNQKSFLKSVNNERSFETKFMVFQIWKTLICQKSIFRSKIRKKKSKFHFFSKFSFDFKSKASLQSVNRKLLFETFIIFKIYKTLHIKHWKTKLWNFFF